MQKYNRYHAKYKQLRTGVRKRKKSLKNKRRFYNKRVRSLFENL